MSNSDDFAFPSGMSKGLTKREYFVAMAFQSLVRTKEWQSWRGLAKDAVRAADALLEELEK